MVEFIKHDLPAVLQVSKIVTIFYMELSKDFRYDGEKHDFWEMVYIDKGEMLCTADKNQFVLRSGEVTFHKPNEYHNLAGDGKTAPNVSILTFECDSPAMERFAGRILRLNAEEKQMLSTLITEGLSCFQLENPSNPLLQKLQLLPDAPFGSLQMTKNLLEIFLIRLHRRRDSLSSKRRQSVHIDGVAVDFETKEILDILQANVYGHITLAEIASTLGKSQSTVKNLFSRFYPGGIMHYYNSLKIREAKRLIREGRYTLSQIAELLCYNSAQYFSKCFRDTTHMTPSEYKRSIMPGESPVALSREPNG